MRGSARLPLICGPALGGVGFAAGFFGPMVLDPESNLGPIVGILFSGPGGALAGVILGVVLHLLRVSNARAWQWLVVACIVLAVGTLYYCLPQPAVRGYVIDAQVEACAPPSQRLDAALTQWEQAVARVTWAAPSANWKTIAVGNVQRDPGVVLTMRIHRKRAILRHRRPWDRNNTSAGPWITVDETRQHYADSNGRACPLYLARKRDLYWPAIGPDSDPARPARVWPPTDTLGFLQLQALGPVPAEYQRVLH